MKRIEILGIPVDSVDRATVIKKIDQFIKEQKPHSLSFINPEIIMKCRQVPELKQMILSADLIAPDGINVLWAAKMLGHSLPERVTGTDILYDISKLSALKGYSIYLLGAAPGIADKAADVLRRLYPGVNIIGTHHGYFEDDEEIVSQIEKLKPDILVVCLGMVKQELWIKKHFDRLRVPVSFGNGGALDFVSGKVKRAPLWIQNIGLEWFCRLMQDFTWRRIKRQSVLFKFVYLVLKSRIKTREYNK